MKACEEYMKVRAENRAGRGETRSARFAMARRGRTGRSQPISHAILFVPPPFLPAFSKPISVYTYVRFDDIFEKSLQPYARRAQIISGINRKTV